MPRHLISTTILCSAIAVATPLAAQQASYCDEGYTVADTNQDNVISEDELTTARDSQFGAMDADGDGMISQQEYTDCMGSWSASSASEPASEEDFAEFDADQDDMVSAQEYMDQVENSSMGSADPGTMQSTSATGDTSASGNDATSGNSGEDGRVLILRRVLLVPQGYDDARVGQMNDDEISARAANRFVGSDGDGDSQLTREEWMSRAEQQQENIRGYMDRMFDRTDADKSGDISRQEYQDAGMKRWQAAQAEGQAQNREGSDTGAPVVIYRYPSTM